MTEAQKVAEELSEAQRAVLDIAATNEFVEMYQPEARKVHKKPLIGCLRVAPSRHSGGQEIVRFQINQFGREVTALLQGKAGG